MKPLFETGKKITDVLMTLIMSFFCSAYQGQDVADEYTVKGIFIYNFTKYIDWTSAKNNTTFVIAVFGESEITKSLKQIALTKKVNNKNIEIKRIGNIEQAKDCQIVFIPRSKNGMLQETIDKLGAKGILIVTEDKDMALKGSCINIISIDGKIKFELNENAVRRDGLKIASQLEALAILIK